MLVPFLAFAAAVLAVGTAVISAWWAGGVPFVALSRRDLPIPIEPFGTIVASGVLVGAFALRRYARRVGIGEDDARRLTLWIVLTGAIGAHVFEILFYQPGRLAEDPLVLLKLWDGISSYGGFIGGGIGYLAFVRWKRLPAGAVADATMIGLLVAFSIGRIGCTLTHDHVGAATGFWLGTDYPRAELARRGLLDSFPDAGAVVRAHNAGMYELLYLVPLNALVLALAFQSRIRVPAGGIAVLIAVAYVPLRFVLEELRLDQSDPRYGGLTFAQWASIAAFAVGAVAAVVVWRARAPAALVPEAGRGPRSARRGA